MLRVMLASASALPFMIDSTAYAADPSSAQALAAGQAATAEQPAESAPPTATQPPASPAAETLQSGEIVVTARKREERLIRVPVAVSTVSAADITRNNANDLAKIGELTPTVIVGAYKANSGGSIAIRGISSSANQYGFESAVAVSIDGIQMSNGRLATLGFFDIAQVEVLKGPQTLFFGKNSPAGVISILSAMPTSRLQVSGRVAYEFVADEALAETAISGPITPSLKGRVALRYRDMKGWMYNDAKSIANPFFTAAQPADAALYPGASRRRIGDGDLLGRLTLQFDPAPNFDAVLKVFGGRAYDQGNGQVAQNIGYCADNHPRVFGIADPYGECRLDNHTANGDIPPAVAASSPKYVWSDGRNRGRTDALVNSLALNWTPGVIKLTSVTGYTYLRNKSASGFDQTSYTAIYFPELSRQTAFSQELRALTQFDGPLNVMVGAYYQSTRDFLYNENWLGSTFVDGRYGNYGKVSRLNGTAESLFGQIIWQVAPALEVDVGGRFSHETKKVRTHNVFGTTSAFGNFNTANVVFATSTDQTPGVLAGKFSDSNFSPEATISWHPDDNSTIYASYKTGFKSGGFGLTSPLTPGSTIGDIDFGSETVTGFEGGAKGEFFDRRLRVTGSAFAYRFKNLQVNNLDAVSYRTIISNAGALKQRGFDVDVNYRASRALTLRSAIAFVSNRFENYTGPCYSYLIPASAALTAAAPEHCSFALNPDGSRVLVGGRPVIQQVFDGRTPARSPKWTGNAGFDFSVPTGSGLRLVLTGDTFYSSSYYAADNLAESSRQSAFWRFNASATLAASDDRWSVSLIGRNLTNKYYLLYATDRSGGSSVPLQPGEQRGIAARGREIALQATIKY